MEKPGTGTSPGDAAHVPGVPSRHGAGDWHQHNDEAGAPQQQMSKPGEQVPHPPARNAGESTASSASSVTLGRDVEAPERHKSQVQGCALGNPPTSRCRHHNRPLAFGHETADGGRASPPSPTAATSGSRASGTRGRTPLHSQYANMYEGQNRAAMTVRFVRRQERAVATSWNPGDVPDALALANAMFPTTNIPSLSVQIPICPELQLDDDHDTVADTVSPSQ